MIRRRGVIVAVVAAVALAACGGDDRSVDTGPGDAEPGSDNGADVAWVHHGQVDGTLAYRAAAAAIEDTDAWQQAWDDHDFDGARPDVDFDTHVVLLVGQAGGGCVDDLVGLEVDAGQLAPDWLGPPGPCTAPLIFRIHAVEVHRGHLPAEFTYGLPEPYADDLDPVTIQLPPFSGDAPPPPEPPQSMTEAEIDAVFDGHAVARCAHELSGWLAPRPVDGPVSDDPGVAEAQQQRADFGVASDEATVRALLDDPPPAVGPENVGFPLTAEEWDLDRAVSTTVAELGEWLHGSSWEDQIDYTVLLDRSDGIRPAVIVNEADAAALGADLDAEFGPGTVFVHVSPLDLAEVAAAQETITRHLDALSELAPIQVITGPPGPAEVSMVDPTREALDAIEDLVDPSLVCIDVMVSGVAPTGGDG